MASLDEAFELLKIFYMEDGETPCQNFYYKTKPCIYCKSNETFPIVNDGGSITYCENCKKTYKSPKIFFEQKK